MRRFLLILANRIPYESLFVGRGAEGLLFQGRRPHPVEQKQAEIETLVQPMPHKFELQLVK